MFLFVFTVLNLIVSSLVQKIYGFLAVLNITGGKFSPHPQKLPFSVTSVDGDNYLLYYSSIDLCGHSSPKKCEGPILTRSLSANGSSDDKARLRIPVKGRLQLVFSLSASLSFSLLFFTLAVVIYSAWEEIKVLLLIKA